MASRGSSWADGGWRLALAVIAVATLAGPVRAADVHDDVIDRVLAVVGGEMITLTDVTAARDFGLVSPGNPADRIRAVLTQLIDRELILAEVDRYAPPEPEADAVDREVRGVRGRFASDQAFQAALMRSGIDEKRLRETLRNDLRIQAYLDQRFALPPSEDELGRYYREHLQTFTRDGTIIPFETARAQVMEAAAADRRKVLVDSWVAGLRRRSDIIDLYQAGR
jgi:hypothetical protein